MVDYTKFKMKSEEELTQALGEKDNLFVIACNKCFKEFVTEDEPECAGFEEIAKAQGKTLKGCAKIDFLCNKTQSERKLQDIVPEGSDNVFVISCGLGIQTVADLVKMPVYAASDTINYTGHHGMALTDRKCEACGQCYLNTTAGICPIVDCSKSLVNGQCGGAKNGKCEVSTDKDCAWEKIYSKYEKQGRVEELVKEPVQLRDYSKINFKFIDEYVKAIREERFEGYYGGIHPTENKEYSEHVALATFPVPKTAVIPMSMHLGAPAVPVVEVGEKVKLGQKIADAGGFISSPIHSSVSGTVTAIEPRKHPITGAPITSVIIESDGKDELHESVKPRGDIDTLSVDEIVEIVRESGIVGMGGAGFPTAVKIKVDKPVDAIIINGCECEPYLTADHYSILEYADDIIYGLKAVMKTTNAAKGIIAIEDNKHDAIELMESKVKDIPNIEIVVAKTKYPQGAEKMLIKRIMNRQVPSGKLPLDVGVVVSNISTVKAISDAIQKGMPLIERVVTVTGEKIKNPGNFVVRIGTPIKELVEHCGGITDPNALIKMGGPMMGFEQSDLEAPIMKGSNGIIAIDRDVTEEVACIKCGRCADVCPMELSPLYYPKYHDDKNWTGMKEKNVLDCIECRCCDFICSSKISIVSKVKAGKQAIREMK